VTLLDFKKAGGAPFAIAAESLEELLDEAQGLGRVEMGQPVLGEGVWECAIAFRRTSGTYVSAKGKDKQRNVAVRKAIIEALELGARVA
jgi:hypothetical protein